MITINKTGLYRFNGDMYGSAIYPAITPAYEPALTCEILLSGAMTQNIVLNYYDHFIKRNSTSNPTYYFHKFFSIDMHIEAGTVFRISKLLSVNGTPSASLTVQLYGNLISE